MTRPARVLYYTLLAVSLVLIGIVVVREFGPQPGRPPENPGDDSNPSVHANVGGGLVVLAVFDQMRGDYLDRWDSYFGSGGFNRMKREGVWFSEVDVPYACTSTGPGHASLVTGAPPSVHGIIENEWWDRKSGSRVYCCQPSRAYTRVPPLPIVPRDLNSQTELGASPERLLAETVGDRLKAVSGGKARVFSLSLKDRTAVLMGGKQPDGAYCFDTRDGVFHTVSYYRELAHPWVTEFNAARHPDKWFTEKWSVLRPDIDYAQAAGHKDDSRGESSGQNGQGRVFPHPFNVKLAAPATRYYDAVECSPAGNELVFELAKKAIAAEKLGQGEATDLLCLSFSSNDVVGHNYGPDSWEVFDITLRSDRIIQELLNYLDTTVGKGRYTLVVTADHGVCPVPERDNNPYPAAKRFTVNNVYPPLALALDAKFGPGPAGPTRWFETDSASQQDRIWPWVWLNHRSITARGLKIEDVTEFTRDWIAGLDFIETAFTRKQIEIGQFPTGSHGEKVKLAYHPERCGDVIAVPKPGVLVSGYTSGTSHGTPHRYDTHIPVLAIGRGIPALGKRTDPKSSLIVAPILSKSLAIDPPKTAAEKSPF